MEWNRVIAALQRLADRGAVAKLLDLRRVRNNPALATDPDYQRAFNGYYRMGRRTPALYHHFYLKFQQTALAPPPTPHAALQALEEILLYIFNNTGEIHLSFSSKMLGTITDAAIIFDSTVASYFNIPMAYTLNWLPDALHRYEQIQLNIQTFVGTPQWQHMRAMFDLTFADVNAIHLPDTRKADLIIWGGHRPSFIIPLPFPGHTESDRKSIGRKASPGRCVVGMLATPYLPLSVRRRFAADRMALMFAASDSMPSSRPVLRTLSADGTSCESGIIWICMLSSFPLSAGAYGRHNSPPSGARGGGRFSRI
jgi:hypothetical protein